MKRYLAIRLGKNGVLGASILLAVALAAGPAGLAAEHGPGAAAPQLPPEIQLDRFLMQADQAVTDGDTEAALSAMERIVALEKEHGIEPPLEDHLRCAQAWYMAGEPERALAAVTDYLQLLGREAPRYHEALRLLNEVENGPGPPADSPAPPVTRTRSARRPWDRRGWSSCGFRRGRSEWVRGARRPLQTNSR